MKKVSTVVIGLSLLTMSALYASGDHTGDHMHEGEMQNHMNKDGMTTNQMKSMDHGKISKNMMHDNMKPYNHSMTTNGYKVTISSNKPLTDGKNHMSIMLMKDGKAVHNAKVHMNFSMPSMPGMEFSEEAKGHGNMYDAMINFSMGGEWAYELMFKASDGSMHKTKGSVNLK